ncbi:hypothetical protein [Microbacterium sp. LEMMJ01]|uniref:hypothetical protein n=1 Tax=Microbacterium sp. LEMMJ01 TaxID=1978350 RepID=UPI000A1F63D0|nr:hypothetical protein [Microbacterium sp. LEMMJ01]OSP07309.1 hypothetical protein B7W94_08415 [Microbacterium sp. LEMMJ01]
MTANKTGSRHPSFPIDPCENVVVRWDGQYWVPRGRHGWRVVTPMPESQSHARDARAINVTIGGATGIFVAWMFSSFFASWSWSLLLGLVIGMAGVVALVAGVVLLLRQRRFTSFIDLEPGDLLGMAAHLDGLPKLVDLDASPPRDSRSS